MNRKEVKSPIPASIIHNPHLTISADFKFDFWYMVY